MLTRFWRWLAHLWRGDATPLPMIDAGDLAALRSAIAPPFNWLREYGPLWTPESHAFWLAPTEHQDLAAWWSTYRPGQGGRVSAYSPLYSKQVECDIHVRALPTTQDQAIQALYNRAYGQGAFQVSPQQAYMASLQEQLQNNLNRASMYPHRSNPLYDILSQQQAKRK